MADRIFTLAEARTMLLELEPILQRMRASKQELDRLNTLIVAVRRSATGTAAASTPTRPISARRHRPPRRNCNRRLRLCMRWACR